MFLFLNAIAALYGPTVWELEGPLPILYTLAILFIDPPFSFSFIIARCIHKETRKGCILYNNRMSLIDQKEGMKP